MGAPVGHFEIQAKDASAMQAFYGDLFDWNIDANNPMNYGVVDTGVEGGIGGGITESTEGTPPSTVFYIEVADPQAKLDEIAARGGTVIVPVTEIPEMVTFAIFADPDGNTVGLVKAEEG